MLISNCSHLNSPYIRNNIITKVFEDGSPGSFLAGHEFKDENFPGFENCIHHSKSVFFDYSIFWR